MQAAEARDGRRASARRANSGAVTGGPAGKAPGATAGPGWRVSSGYPYQQLLLSFMLLYMHVLLYMAFIQHDALA